MGAQTVQSIEEVAFTSLEDSMLISLADGRVLEVFGDGMIQVRLAAENLETKILYV